MSASGLVDCALIRLAEKSVVPSGVIVGAELGAFGLLQARLEACLQAAAERVVGGDEVPLLAVAFEQQLRHRIGFHARRVADAEHVPMALRAGDRVGVAAGHDMKYLLLEADIGHGLRQRRVDVAEQEVDLVALDQLICFLHGDGGFTAGRIFDQQDRPCGRECRPWH